MARPVWADPQFALATSSANVVDVTLPAGVPVLVLPASPRRFAVTFWSLTSVPLNTRFAPWADTDKGHWVLASSTAPIALTLFEYGALVMREWWGVSDGGGTIRIAELITE